MFKLKFENIKDPSFTAALRKLMQFNGYKDTKTAYNIAKIGKKFDAEAKICQELFITHVKKFCSLDAKGEMVPRVQMIKDAKGVDVETKLPGTYVIPAEKQDAFEKASLEFDSTEFEIPCHKVKLSDIDGAKMTPADMLALEPLLTEIEVADKPGAVVGLKKPTDTQPTVQ